MQFTEAQKTLFQTRFAARRRNQVVLAILLVALASMAVFSEIDGAVLGIPSRILMSAAGALVLAAPVFTLFNWRCPACNRYLGRRDINPRRCAKCGFQLH